MKKLLIFTLAFLLHISAFAQYREYQNPKSIIVKLKANANDTRLSTEAKFDVPVFNRARTEFPVENIKMIGNRKLQNTYVLYFETEQDINAAIEKFNQTQLFEYVEPNYGGTAAGQQFEVLNTTPNDALFSRQWGLQNDGTFPLGDAEAGVDIQMEEAWDIETGDPNLVIAVLDSGVKLDHPELAGRLWTNPDEVMDGTDTDGNGFIDDVNGWNFAYETNNVADDVGHGVNITGLLASLPNNNTAYAGINWASKIMTVKMLNSDNAYLDGAWAVDAIYYAVDNGADIINMSWGGPDFSALQDAVEYAHNNGVVLTAAMMNFDNNVPYYPAAYDETIAVGSIDPDGDRSSPFYWDPNSGSNFGPHIDVIAPGNYTYSLSHTSNSNYNIYWGGTSQAAPHVAGIASLLLSQDPTLSPEDIRSIVTATADDQTGDPAEDTPGFDNYFGHGRLNAFAALSANLSVADIEVNSIAVYPNPVESGSILNMEFKSEGLKKIEIFNVLGSKVQAFETTAKTAAVSTSNFSSGVYLFKIHTEENSSFTTKKVIIR